MSEKLTIEELELTLDFNFEEFQKNIEKVFPQFGKVVEKFEKIATQAEQAFNRNINFQEMNEKVSSQFGKLNEQVSKTMTNMQQSTDKASSQIGQNLSENFKQSRVVVNKEVAAMLDGVESNLRQAQAQSKKIEFLKSKQSDAELSGDGGTFAKTEEQIAQANERMLKYENSAKATAKAIKKEFENIPDSLESITTKLNQKESQIERIRKEVELLNQKYQEQRSITSLDPQNPSYEENEKSLKALAVLQKKEEQLDKVVEQSIRLQEAYGETEERAQELGKAVDRLNSGLSESTDMKEQSMGFMERLKTQYEQLAKESRRLESQLPNPFSRLNQTVKKSSGIIGAFANHFKKSTNNISNHSRGASHSISGIGRSMKSLTRNLIVFQIIGRAIRSMTSGLLSALKTNDQFSASLNQIKGNLLTAFYPIYTTVLPAINALMSALAKLTGYLASFIATLFGTTFTTAQQGAQGLYNNAKAVDSVGNSATDTKKKVDKLKRALMGFDEINRLDLDDSDDTSGAGGGGNGGGAGGVGGIDWGEIIDPGVPKWMQNIIDLLEDFFKPFKDSWDKYGYRVIEEWQYMLKEVIGLAKAIGRSFMEVWTNGSGERFLGNILLLTANVLGIVGDIARAFRIAWEECGRGTAFIQSIFDALNAVLELLIVITQAFRNAWNDESGVNIARHLLEIFTNINLTIAYIATGLKEAWLENLAGERIIGAILGIFEDVLKHINYMTYATKEWARNLDFTPLLESIAVLLEALRPLTDRVGEGLAWFYSSVLLPLAAWTITDLLPSFLNVLATILDVLSIIIDASKPAFAWFWDSFLVPIAQWTGGIIISVLEKLAHWLQIIGNWCRENEAVIQAITVVALAFASAWLIVKGAMIAVNVVLGIYNAIATVAAIATLILKAPFILIAGAILAVVTTLYLLYEKFEWFQKAIDPIVNGIKSLWNGFLKLFGKGTKDASDEAAEAIDDLDKKSNKSTENMSNTTVGNVEDLQSGTVSALETTSKEGTDIMKSFTGDMTDLSGTMASTGTSDMNSFQSNTLTSLETTNKKGSNEMEQFSKNVTKSTDNLSSAGMVNMDQLQTGALSSLTETNQKGSNAMNDMSKNVTGSTKALATDVNSDFEKINSNTSKTFNHMSADVDKEMNTLNKTSNAGLKELEKSFTQSFKQIHKIVKTFSNQMPKDVRNAFTNLPLDMRNIGLSVMDGLNRGLLDGRRRVLNTANATANDIARIMKNALNINSPSRVMRDEIGRWIPEGIAVGIEENSDSVMNSLYDIAHDMQSVDLQIPSVFYDEPIPLAYQSRQASTEGLEDIVGALINALTAEGQKVDANQQELTLELNGSVLGRMVLNEIKKEIRRLGVNPLMT